MNRRFSPNTALAASALVLTGLVIVAAGPFDRAGAARGDLVAGTGDVTAITVEAQSDDILLVIDNRTEHLMAYKVLNQNSLELFKSYSLPRMFADARNRAGGRVK